jgi:magnesium transporter
MENENKKIKNTPLEADASRSKKILPQKAAAPATLPELPPQELPEDIPAEVKEKLQADLSESKTNGIREDLMDADREEMSEADGQRDRLSKSRLLKLLMKKQYQELREVTEDEQPADLAELLEELDENNRLVVFRLLKKDVATEAFTYMSDEARNDLVEAFSDVELVNALEVMSLDDAADLLEDMPASVVKRVLEKSSKKTRESLNKLLHYPESSAGSIMTPEYVRLRQGMNVGQAFQAIRAQGENAETVYTGYVVEKNRLVGVVSAKDLLLSDFSTPIADLMDDNVVSVKVTDDQEDVAREMQKYDFNAMPVVDNEGMLVGIVTIDDAVDVLTQESTEDMQKMAAILPEDSTATYFGTSVWQHAKQRIPWLLILMLSATFTGMVTTHYEAAFVSLPLLVSFMPMLMDTAGNCGNQTSTLMVRGLALGEVSTGDFMRVLGKELRIAVIVGAALGLVNGLRIYLMYDVLYRGQYENVFGYAVVVSISLFCAVILAKLVGGILPLAAKKLGADPAIMATPFITTIVDACSLIIYFKIAMVVFSGQMSI